MKNWQAIIKYRQIAEGSGVKEDEIRDTIEKAMSDRENFEKIIFNGILRSAKNKLKQHDKR